MIHIHICPYPKYVNVASLNTVKAAPEDALTHKPYRQILLYLLQKHFGISAADARFAKTDRGKPYLLNQRVFFSLSHSGNCLAIALSRDCEVGVDIEHPLSRSPSYLRIAQRYFSQLEADTLATQCEPELKHAFYAMWTQKEAIVKATGEGLSSNFELLDTTQFLNNRVPGNIIAQAPWIQHWHLPTAFALPKDKSSAAPIENDLYLSLAAITGITSPPVSITTGETSADKSRNISSRLH